MEKKEKLRQQVDELQKTLDNLKKKLNEVVDSIDSTEKIIEDTVSDNFKLMLVGESKYRKKEEVKTLSLVSFIAPKFLLKQIRKSLDLVAIVDHSGSMNGHKMKNMKQALTFIINQLHSDDTFTVVLFDSMVTCPLRQVKQDIIGKERSRSVIRNIQSGTCTNLCGGISRGLDEITKLTLSDKRDQLVICCTDGIANEGAYTTTTGLVNLVKSYLYPEDKVVLSRCKFNTFGFGGDHNVEALRAISEMARGMYYYIEKQENIPQSIADCLAGVLSVCAQNIQMTIKPINGAKITQIMTKYEVREEGGSFVVELGDLFLEERRDIPIKLVLPEVNYLDSPEYYMEVTVEYLDVTKEIAVKKQSASTVSFIRTEQEIYELENRELMEQLNRWVSITYMEEAQKYGEQNEYKKGQEKLKQAMEKIRNSCVSNSKLSIYLLKELKKVHDNMNTREEFNTAGKYLCATQTQSSGRQRSSATDSVGAYTTSQQNTLRRASTGNPDL